MTIVAAAPYRFPVADVRENFPAPLLYIGWDQHLMFCAPFCLPLPPDQCDPLNFAPKGTELPIAPKFKGSLIARYSFPLASFEANLQGAFAFESTRRSAS